MKLRKILFAIAGTSALTLAACGGGGGGTTSAPVVTPPATTLSGTAAIGAPIAGSVFAIDVNGKTSPAATTSALGAFTLDVAGMTAPFMLTITGTSGGQLVTLNSVATAAGQTVNITPLTDLIVSTASGQPAGASLASLCAPVAGVVPAACKTALSTAATPARLDAAVAAVTEMIKPLNTAGTNPLTGAFVANGTGMDSVLDRILVEPAEAQGAMASVTLIATRTPLGTVTLPAKSGDAATIPAATAPASADLAKATAAANVLPEIRQCLSNLSALYPKTGFTVPTAAAVTPFIDSSFSLGASAKQADIIAELTNPAGIAKAGLVFESPGLSQLDMAPLTSTELATLTSTTSTSTTRVADFTDNRIKTGLAAITYTAGVPSSAWIKIHLAGDAGMDNWKVVKTTDTKGCPGGWKLAGNFHPDMHMNARVQRDINGTTTTFTREWAFHIDKETVLAENPATTAIDVRGPGLMTYGDFKNTGTASKLILILPQAGGTAMRVADSTGTASTFYNNAEALQSCQDLASISPAPANLTSSTMCIDETKTSPGKFYVWTLKTATGPYAAFPFQTNAVPLSKAFAIANQASLYATVTSVSPTGYSALKADTLLDGVITFNYTISPTYGAKMDHCAIYLSGSNPSTVFLNAEQNAVGSETSCKFTTAGLNSLASNVPDPSNSGGSLFKFTGTFTSGRIAVSTSVLGNMAGSTQAYPQ